MDLLAGTDAVMLQAFKPPSHTPAPLTLLQLGDMYMDFDTSDSFCHFVESQISEQDRVAIEKLSRGQTKSRTWKEQRIGAITSSIMHSACHYGKGEEDNYVLQAIMGESTFKGNEATEYGKKMEPVARNLYKKWMSGSHRGFKVQESGLHICGSDPMIRASPDGIVSCKCCSTDGIIEIKSPFTHREKTAKEICDEDYHVYLGNDGLVHLKTTSPWYTQIQTQMGVCACNWCDFVMYSNASINVERIPFDSDFWEETKTKALAFYREYVIPRLLRDF